VRRRELDYGHDVLSILAAFGKLERSPGRLEQMLQAASKRLSPKAQQNVPSLKQLQVSRRSGPKKTLAPQSISTRHNRDGSAVTRQQFRCATIEAADTFSSFSETASRDVAFHQDSFS
jgi:hypothetical protein